PTREGVPAHLRLTHAVEEELEIPSDAGQSAKQIVSYKWNAHRFPQHVGRRVDKHAGRRAGERGFFDGLWTAWIIELRHRQFRSDIFVSRPVSNIEIYGPNEVGRESAEEHNHQHRQALPQIRCSRPNGKRLDRISRCKTVSETGAHDA